MIKNHLNRERLEKIKSWRETYGAGSNVILSAEEAEELARMALAAMESEPVRNPVLAYADSYRDMAKQGVESVPIWSVITDLERNIAPLYRHAQQPVVDIEPTQMFGIGSIFKPQVVSEQEADCDDCAHYNPKICHGEGCPAISQQSARPAPVVPEEKPMPNTLSMYAVDAVAAIAEVKGWNACRAAMLAAAPQEVK